MKVSIKDLSINMDLGNNGVTFDVYGNDGKFLGDLRLGKGTVEWCKGKTKAGNGVKMNWNEFIKKVGGEDEKPAKKAVKTPKKKPAA